MVPIIRLPTRCDGFEELNGIESGHYLTLRKLLYQIFTNPIVCILLGDRGTIVLLEHVDKPSNHFCRRLR